MAISTYKTFLMHKTSTDAWEKLLDIKEFPDLGGAPEMLETTTMSDKMQTYIMGIQSADALDFTCNYDKTEYSKLIALSGKTESYAIWMGGTEEDDVVTPSGTDGKFTFDGQLSVYVNGANVNEVIEMTVTIAPSTPIEMA